MVGDNKIHMPGGFGGITRYDEEYESRFKISPAQAIGFIVAVALFVVALKIFWPIG